jgi:hypothetical protein
VCFHHQARHMHYLPLSLLTEHVIFHTCGSNSLTVVLSVQIKGVCGCGWWMAAASAVRYCNSCSAEYGEGHKTCKSCDTHPMLFIHCPHSGWRGLYTNCTHVIDRRVSRAVAKWRRRLMRNWSVREKKRLGHFRTRSTVITPLVHSPNSNTKRCKHLRSSVCWLVLSCVVALLLRVMA